MAKTFGRNYRAADARGIERCAQTIRLGSSKDDVAQCMRAAVDGQFCKQHAKIADRDRRRPLGQAEAPSASEWWSARGERVNMQGAPAPEAK